MNEDNTNNEASAALQELQALYHSLVDQMPAGIFRKDRAGRYVFANPWFCQLRGLKADQIVGRTPDELVAVEAAAHSQTRPEILQLLRDGSKHHEEILRTGKPIHVEEVYPAADGGKRYLHVVKSAVFGSDGQIVGTQGIQFDVTDRKQVEAELKHERDSLQTLLDNSPDNIYFKDTQSRFVKCSNTQARFFGMASPDELVGKTDFDFFREADARPRFEDEQEIIRTGRAMVAKEEWEERKAGHITWESSTKMPWLDDTGKIIGIIGISRDITERKNADEAVRRSQEEFKDLFDNAPVGFHEVDVEGRLVRINNTELKMLGYSGEELLGQFVWKISANEELSRQATLAKLKGEEPPSEGFERRFRRKDGSTFPVWIKDRLLKRADGVITGIRAAIQDITESKQAADALARERQLLRTLVDVLPETFYVKDLDSRFLVANEVLAKQNGKATPAQLIGSSDADFFPPEVAAKFRAEELKVFAGEPLIGHEDTLVFPDGQKHTMLTVKLPFRDGQGRICGLVGIGHDITERKRAETALRDNEAFLNTVIENIPHMIFVKDAKDLRFLKFNKAGQELLGYSLAELAGKNDHDSFTKELADHFTENDQKVLNGKEVVDIPEESVQTRNKGERILHTKKIPIFDNAGQLLYLMGISEDITERRKLEENLRQAQKMEGIGQLAGGVAHDFNNILAVIQLQTGLLKSGGNLSPAQSDLAEQIGAATQRAAALTRQLLLFSRKNVLKPSNLDLNQSIGDVAKMLRRTLGEQIQMQVKFAMQPQFIHADAGMMDQVLMNLAVNARDAMPKGGQLIIEISPVDFDESIHAQSIHARPGSFVCLSVSDTGCGMPPEILSHIFEPFFTTKDIGKGTGLGLATVFGIVQQHKGWINVYSEAGHGTTFRIYLPRLAGMTWQKTEPTTSPSVPGGNETILLVEDEAPLRILMRRTLGQLGYRVLEAVNGVEASELWKQNQGEVDLLLTDVVMPGGISGKDLAGRLLQENPRLKVIYASGYSADVAGKDSFLVEGVNFLTKPFEARKLAQIVRQKLDASNTAASSHLALRQAVEVRPEKVSPELSDIVQ